MNGIREVGWWRWPLWSWRNLGVTAIAAVLLVGGVGRISDGVGSEAATPGPGAVRTTDTPSHAPAQSAQPSVPPSSDTPSAPVPLDLPEEVAVAFVRAWARPNAANEEWRMRCQ